MVIDFDSADFHLAENDGSLSIGSSVQYNCPVDLSKMYEDLDYSQGIHGHGKSVVYRESDIMSDEKRIKTEYYRKVYQVNNWHYSLQLILAFNEKFLGTITLYRLKEKADFKYSDIFLMEMIKDHLAFRIFSENEKNSISGKLSISQAAEKFDLTKREFEILNLLMQGLDNPKICEMAFISNNTLKKHILNIYKKLQINSRIQLFKTIKEYNPTVL